MLSNIGTLQTISFSAMPSASAGGRTYIPVDPHQFMYSQFEYVAGVPAAKGQTGISVDRLKILNTLIDHLVSMKQKNVMPKVEGPGELSNDQIDALIKQYQDQIKTVTAAAADMPYKGASPLRTGIAVDLVA